MIKSHEHRREGNRFSRLGLSLIAWVAVWAFWLVVTRSSHPSFLLTLIVTTSLISAYAITAYLNHLVLIPIFWNSKQRIRYWAVLLATMTVLTALALSVIRWSYFHEVGPDADPNGVYKHFAIDFFGMAVHLIGALIIVKIANRRHA